MVLGWPQERLEDPSSAVDPVRLVGESESPFPPDTTGVEMSTPLDPDLCVPCDGIRSRGVGVSGYTSGEPTLLGTTRLYPVDGRKILRRNIAKGVRGSARYTPKGNVEGWG